MAHATLYTRRRALAFTRAGVTKDRERAASARAMHRSWVATGESHSARPSAETESPQIRLVAMLVTITAFMPCIFVIVPMVIAIIEAFAWPDDAAQNKAHQSQKERARSDALYVCHVKSYSVSSTNSIHIIIVHTMLTT
jgi:thiol:disulfide interchange protein